MPVRRSFEHVVVHQTFEVAETIRDNINYLCKVKKCKKKDIAEACEVSKPLVTKWTAKKFPVLPSVDRLLTIANFFEVDVNWLISKHDKFEFPDYTATYNSAFFVLLSLFQRGIIEPTDIIHDPILEFLVNRYDSLRNGGIMEADIEAWLKKINEEFNIPIREYNNDTNIHREILLHEPGIAVVDDEMKYRNLANALNNDEIVNAAFERVHRDEIENKMKDFTKK